MRIIELCGIPGAGKSTLIKNLKQSNPDITFLTRDDILCQNKLIRHYNTFFQLVLCKIGFEWKELKPIYRFISEYPNHEIIFEVRLIDLFRKLRKRRNRNEVILLEEGPIQYLSSIPFDVRLKNSENLYDSVDLLDAEKYIIVDCQCEIDTSITRLKHRSKGSDRYSNKSNEELKQLLEVKRNNLDTIIHISDSVKYTLSMEDEIEVNVYKLRSLLKNDL